MSAAANVAPNGGLPSGLRHAWRYQPRLDRWLVGIETDGGARLSVSDAPDDEGDWLGMVSRLTPYMNLAVSGKSRAEALRLADAALAAIEAAERSRLS